MTSSTQPDLSAIFAAFGPRVVGMTKSTRPEWCAEFGEHVQKTAIDVHLPNGQARIPLPVLFDRRQARFYLAQKGLVIPRSTPAQWHAALRSILSGTQVPSAGSRRSQPIVLCRELIRTKRRESHV
jgi:hypothetical protein